MNLAGRSRHKSNDIKYLRHVSQHTRCPLCREKNLFVRKYMCYKDLEKIQNIFKDET
jgi:hypothetical protein